VFIMTSEVSMSSSRRTAFTLVELLVVISIIAVLMGLLLPAVQSAREAGRRASCSNNQYQLAFACIRHNDTNGFLPGWRNALPWANATASGIHAPSWPVMILPFMERNDIYKAWQQFEIPATPYVSFFVCSSSPPDALASPTLAYAGNCGSASNLASRRFDGVMVDNVTTAPTMVYRSTLDAVSDGDGASMTLLLSEKCLSGTTAFVQGTWSTIPATGNGTFNFTNGSVNYVPGFGVTATRPPKVVNSTVIGSTNNTTAGLHSMPSSNHPGGAVAAFCDGRAGFLKDSLAPEVYAQLLSPDHVKSANQWGAASAHPLSEGAFQ